MSAKYLNKEKFSFETLCKVLTCAFLFLMIVWRIPFLNRGIDYTDTGFNMANYRDFFMDLSSNGIGMFLTNLLGSLMYNVLPAYQLLVFRVLHWGMWTGTYLLIFFTFKRKDPCYFNVLLSALLLAVSAYQKIGEAIYSYYPFSMLMVAIATYLMYTAVIQDKKIRLIISGLVLGINVGVRLPNLLFFSLVLCVLWYYICKKQSKTGFIRCGLMLIGIVVGAVVTIGSELLIIGTDAVTSSAASYTNLATSSTQDHGIINQILHIFMQIYLALFDIAICVFPILLVGFVFLIIYRLVFKKHIGKPMCKGVLYSVITVMSFVWFGIVINGMIDKTEFLHVFGLISLAFAVISVFALMKRKPELSFASTIVILSAGCIVVGTDLGITRFTDVLPQLCVALVIGAVYIVPVCSVEKNKLRHFIGVYFNRAAKTTVSVMLGLALVLSAFTMIPETYNDSKFSELTTKPSKDIVTLRGMKTSPERAESLNNLYYAMTQSEEVGDKPVAVIGMFPLIFNMVDNENYFSSSCIDYNSVSIETLQRQYEVNKADGIYPVIVISRLHMNQNNLNDYCNDADKRALFDTMLADCEYNLVFTDDNFDVYAPVDK